MARVMGSTRVREVLAGYPRRHCARALLLRPARLVKRGKEISTV
jgi:hypothetical protein